MNEFDQLNREVPQFYSKENLVDYIKEDGFFSKREAEKFLNDNKDKGVFELRDLYYQVVNNL